MNFDLGESELGLVARLRECFNAEARSDLSALEGGDALQVAALLRRWLPRLADTGYLEPGLEDGRNSAGLVAVQEALAGISSSLYLAVEASTRIFGRLIAAFGTPEQKETILAPLKEGRLLGAVGLTEGGMSLDRNPPATSGEPAGASGYRVSGRKSQVVNGPVADWIAAAGSAAGAAAVFLVPRGAPGLACGEPLALLGHRGLAVSSLALADCLIPARQVIGPLPEPSAFQRLRDWEDQVLVAAALGAMQRSFEEARDYAKTHVSGGKPIIAYQEVGFKLAEMLTLLQTARLLAYRAAWLEEAGDREAPIVALCAKVFCGEAAEKVSSEALQILGVRGYLAGNPAEAGYRDAKYFQLAGTSTEISRVKIGDGLLARPL